MKSAVIYAQNNTPDNKRCHDESWDFREADTKILSHGLHTYPAMMIPQIARRLLNTYGADAEVLLDPFMGSGTSIVEAKVSPNIKTAYGVDINPLARLISKVKCTPIDESRLHRAADELIDKCSSDIFNANLGNLKVTPFDFKNIDFWFKKDVIRDLTIIKSNIDEVSDNDLSDFFKAAFSEIVRIVSNTRNSEFKLYRMNEKSLEKHNPNTLEIFSNRLNYNIEKLSEFNNSANDCQIHILSEDTRKSLSIPDNSVDIIVSSPPYGDSRTTVAYGQFSRLSLEFLGYNVSGSNDIDKTSLGGVKADDFELELDSPTLKKEIELIKAIDTKRAYEVISFYQDFIKCVYEIDRVMKSGGYICLVVGDRTVKTVKLSTDIIISEFFLSLGNYLHEKTIIRNIPNKRMPKANSPTNVKGMTLSTMNEEYIIILKKN